jgi:hypothetical protein
MREVELRRLLSGGARGSRTRAAAEVTAYLLRFILFDGARVGLLLSHTDGLERIQDGVALDF